MCYVIDSGFIRPDQHNVDKILNIQRPETKRQVKQLIGLIHFCNLLIRISNGLMRRLNDLLRTKTWNKIHWSQEHEIFHDKIKTFLSNAPFLLSLNTNHPFTLNTDCSYLPWGFAYSSPKMVNCTQLHIGIEKFKPTEAKMSTRERQFLSMCVGILKLKRYLLGTHFCVEVDNKEITCPKTKSIINAKILRWLLQFQNFSFSAIRGK